LACDNCSIAARHVSALLDPPVQYGRGRSFAVAGPPRWRSPIGLSQFASGQRGFRSV
jgi:hypothetical protein